MEFNFRFAPSRSDPEKAPARNGRMRGQLVGFGLIDDRRSKLTSNLHNGRATLEDTTAKH